MTKKLKTVINDETKKSRSKLVALCEVLGLPSNYFLELKDFVVEVKIK